MLKVKILEAKYEAKLEFPGGKNLQWGEYGYFLEIYILSSVPDNFQSKGVNEEF